MNEKDILLEDDLKEKARRKKAKEQEVAYHEQYLKPKKVETYSKEIHTSQGTKIKTIEKRIYSNGVVKERLKRVEKDMGMGKKQRIF